ncbi:hypothetical protein [Acetobacter fallax]|uniref:Uncharacterized protein n=1 Tax=Acetobacter fallax TaxID=1737473 RepID=A0ABX0KCT5_9PROT|nr:hypothetical protein [Acetobacter fallax]NHO34254.1 hypothetical protein [Acetobacter fallax]NHO37803.1 hypothetical protein [Acetobacter fallax]
MFGFVTLKRDNRSFNIIPDKLNKSTIINQFLGSKLNNVWEKYKKKENGILRMLSSRTNKLPFSTRIFTAHASSWPGFAGRRGITSYTMRRNEPRRPSVSVNKSVRRREAYSNQEVAGLHEADRSGRDKIIFANPGHTQFVLHSREARGTILAGLTAFKALSSPAVRIDVRNTIRGSSEVVHQSSRGSGAPVLKFFNRKNSEKLLLPSAYVQKSDESGTGFKTSSGTLIKNAKKWIYDGRLASKKRVGAFSNDLSLPSRSYVPTVFELSGSTQKTHYDRSKKKSESGNFGRMGSVHESIIKNRKTSSNGDNLLMSEAMFTFRRNRSALMMSFSRKGNTSGESDRLRMTGSRRPMQRSEITWNAPAHLAGHSDIGRVGEPDPPRKTHHQASHVHVSNVSEIADAVVRKFGDGLSAAPTTSPLSWVQSTPCYPGVHL